VPDEDKKPKKPKGGDKPKGNDKGTPKDKINQDEIEQEYGLSYALFQAFPELKELLGKATAGTWSPTRFQVELRQTDWFKKHSDIWRQNTALKYSDPTTYNERLNNSLTMVQNLAGAYGAGLSADATKRLAERALLLGMSEDQIRDKIANFVIPSADHTYGGQLAPIEDQLRGTALRNGVRIGDDQLQSWMRNIVRGNSSQEQYQTFIRNQAAASFPAYGEQIKGGMDLADVAAPYVQSMADILEMNPAGIDLYDRTLRRALSNTDDKGQHIPMSISAFEDSLRQDPRWAKTKQANEQARGYAQSIAKMWGLTA
jgi:hypothetical protein